MAQHHQNTSFWIDSVAAAHARPAGWPRTRRLALVLLCLCMATGLLQGVLYLHRAAIQNAPVYLVSAGAMSFAANARRPGPESISRGELPYEGEPAMVLEAHVAAGTAQTPQEPQAVAPAMVPVAQPALAPDARIDQARKKELARMRRQAAQEWRRQQTQGAAQSAAQSAAQ